MLEDVHDEERPSSNQQPDIVLAHPQIEQPISLRVERQDDPADAAHRARSFEASLSQLVRTKVFFEF